MSLAGPMTAFTASVFNGDIRGDAGLVVRITIELQGDIGMTGTTRSITGESGIGWTACGLGGEERNGTCNTEPEQYRDDSWRTHGTSFLMVASRDGHGCELLLTSGAPVVLRPPNAIMATPLRGRGHKSIPCDARE